ncbi:hypothetical protein HDR61_01625 [bacterium]|nr:hypothetical protein [bacterium]
MQNKKQQTNFEKNFIAQKYDDVVSGLKLTPEQDKELRKLYSRATIPVKPWGFVFAGDLVVNLAAGIYTMAKCCETRDVSDSYWYFAFLGAQFIAALVFAQRMLNAEKKLHNRIDNIRSEYLRQISR